MNKKMRVFTKPDEIKIKLKTETLTKSYRKATFYFGKKIIDKLFTTKEQKEGVRILVSVINSSILIEKAKKDEGIKLFLQGNGALGVRKCQASLYGELICKLTEFKVKDFEFIKNIKMIRINLDCSELDGKSIDIEDDKNKKLTKPLTKRELAPIDKQIRIKVNEYKKTFRLYFTKKVYDNLVPKNSGTGRVKFEFHPASSSEDAYISMIRINSDNKKEKTKGNKILKVASYTVVGIIPSSFDLSGINTDNHIVRYRNVIEDENGVYKFNIYPEFKRKPLLNSLPVDKKCEENVTTSELGIELINSRLNKLEQKYQLFSEACIKQIKYTINECNRIINRVIQNDDKALEEILLKKMDNLEKETFDRVMQTIMQVLENKFMKLRTTITDTLEDLLSTVKDDDSLKVLYEKVAQIELTQQAFSILFRQGEQKIKDLTSLEESLTEKNNLSESANTRFRLEAKDMLIDINKRLNELLRRTVDNALEERKKQEGKSFLKALKKFFG